jgi:hypothetical protein
MPFGTHIFSIYIFHTVRSMRNPSCLKFLTTLLSSLVPVKACSRRRPTDFLVAQSLLALAIHRGHRSQHLRPQRPLAVPVLPYRSTLSTPSSMPSSFVVPWPLLPWPCTSASLWSAIFAL